MIVTTKQKLHILLTKRLAGKEDSTDYRKISGKRIAFVVDEIAITLGLNEYNKLERIVAMCEKSGVHTKFIPDYNNIIPTRITEFQNFSRYSGLFKSTVVYWLKDTISGINFKFTFSEI